MDPRNIVLANLKRITGTVILTGSGDTSIPSSPSVVNTAEKQVILNEVVDTSTGNNSESDNIVPSNVDEDEFSSEDICVSQGCFRSVGLVPEGVRYFGIFDIRWAV